MSEVASPQPQEPKPQPQPPSKMKSMAVRVGIIVGLALLVFLIGWFVGRGPVGELKDRAESAEQRLALASDHINMSIASSLLYQTALDLEARNFGVANGRLDEAVAALDSMGAGGSELEALRTSMASTDFSVAADLGDQRATALGFADALNGLLSDPSVPQNDEVE